MQNNNITDVESLKLFFDGCNTDYYDSDFLYYDTDNTLQGRVLLYGNKIPESAYRRVASRFILGYEVCQRYKDSGDSLTGKTWLEAQQPVADENNSSDDNDNGNTTNNAKVVQLDDGNWYRVVNGAVDYSYTGVASNEYGWFYIRNGALDWGYTGLANNEYGWFYVKNGALDWGYTGVANNEYGWFYVKNGALDWGYTGVAYSEYGWFYVKNGVLDWSYTGVANNEYGWFYIKNGALDWGYTGLACNEYGTWYIVNGVVAFDYTGTINNVSVVNGQVVGHEHSWVHHDDEYGEKFISKDNMRRYDSGTYIVDDGYEVVEEGHIICGTCRKDLSLIHI